MATSLRAQPLHNRHRHHRSHVRVYDPTVLGSLPLLVQQPFMVYCNEQLDEAQIKQAWKAMAKKVHPDKNPPEDYEKCGSPHFLRRFHGNMHLCLTTTSCP